MDDKEFEIDMDFSNYEETEKLFLKAISLQPKKPDLATRYFKIIYENAPFDNLKSGSLVSISAMKLNDFTMEWMTKNKRKYKLYKSIKSHLDEARELNPENTVMDSVLTMLHFINEEFDLATFHLRQITTPGAFDDFEPRAKYAFQYIEKIPMVRRRAFMSKEAIEFYNAYIYNGILTPSATTVLQISNIFSEATTEEQAIFHISTHHKYNKMNGDAPICYISPELSRALSLD